MSELVPERVTTYTHEGLLFDVIDEGPLDAAPDKTVVLLHGFPERATSWRKVAPLLHEHGVRTLAPDQRGYSPHARPGRRHDYVTPKLAGDVIALIEAVGGPVHLVGHDWGAAVGWFVAAHRPDLVTTWTAFSVPHPAAYASALLGPQGPKSWYMAAFNIPGLPERLAAQPGGLVDRMLRSSGMTEEELARYRQEIVDDGALPGALMWYRALPLTIRGMGSAAPVEVPTTMVWSDRDTAIDRLGVERTARHVRGRYEYVELTGVSHWIPTQAPEAAAEAILNRIGGA